MIVNVKELWDDATGQYCSEVTIDGKPAATMHSKWAETRFLDAICFSTDIVQRDRSRMLRLRRAEP